MKLLAVLVLASSCLQDPAPEAEAQRLARDLSDPKLEVRDAAGRKLLELGDAAVEPLRKHLAGVEDAEARARIQALLARLTRDPLQAARDYCKDELKGEFGIEDGRRGGGRLELPAAAKWLPGLVLVQAWVRMERPSSWILLGFRRKERDIVELRTWEETAKHLRAAEKDEELPELAALLATLHGTCRLCPTEPVPATAFALERKDGSLAASARYVHGPADAVHVTYDWRLAFGPDRAPLRFETKKDYRTKHR